MDRRNFFRSEPLAGVLLPDLPVAAGPGDLSLIRVSRRAMATTFEIALPFGTPHAMEAAEEALELIDELEDQLTVYRDTSEVSQLNMMAATGPVIVEQKLFDLLHLAATLTNDTQGAFDIATGSLIRAWGFYKREGRLPPLADLGAARDNSGMRHVILNAEMRSVATISSSLPVSTTTRSSSFPPSAKRLTVSPARALRMVKFHFPSTCLKRSAS